MTEQDQSNTKIHLLVGEDHTLLRMIAEHMLANSQYPIIASTLPDPREIDEFDLPDSCGGIAPRNRKERRARKNTI